MSAIPFAGVFVGGGFYCIFGSKMDNSWTMYFSKIVQILMVLLMFVEIKNTQILARFVYGICIALTSPSSMSLITECTPGKYRGSVVPIPAISFGVT